MVNWNEKFYRPDSIHATQSTVALNATLAKKNYGPHPFLIQQLHITLAEWTMISFCQLSNNSNHYALTAETADWRSRQITKSAPHHSIFYRPTNSIKALKATIVPEKSCGNKKCDQEEEETERQNFGLFGIGLKYLWHGCLQLFWYLYVHSVQDSTQMSIFDQFHFSFVFLGFPKMSPNRYT